MRIFALSDIHLDYEENRNWLADLSDTTYQADMLILAGDISDSLELVEWCFVTLKRKFLKVFFVPGNHELWVIRNKGMNSLEKFDTLLQLARDNSISMDAYHHGNLSIVPFFGWYDYSFGFPNEELLQSWVDFNACRWPGGMNASGITNYFLQFNREATTVSNDVVISFSHFLPRIDIMPAQIPQRFRYIYPVLGSSLLDQQIRAIRSNRHIHLYGHSHVNRRVIIDNIEYMNNAFGYPSEGSITRKQLVCIYSV
ncbi:metallophosphoesterase [Gynuella sp.]|uniref:metallophosphoesterase n=1 Tax=Gynuella sp. TaxID=2969146 RepID=UPI003D0EB4C0